MKIIKKISNILITIVFIFISCTSAANTTTPLHKQIQQAIDDFRISNKIPAIQLSIGMPDETTILNFASGTMTLDDKSKPATPDSLFYFGSCTKSFTAAIILQLESEGKLNINDSITKYLPQYSKWSGITIKQLLNHTSGIFDYTDDSEFEKEGIELLKIYKIWQPHELIAIAAKPEHKPYFEPGKGWHYSNTNYILAGMIIEKITGNSYENEIKERILKNNLNNTYFANIYSDDLMSRVAHSYKTSDNEILDDTYSDVSWGWSAGAIASNTQDFVRWGRLLFQKGKILDESSLAKMQSLVCTLDCPQCKAGELVSLDTKGYGLGVFMEPSAKYGSIWGHDGGIYSYSTMFLCIPKYNTTFAIASSGALNKEDVGGWRLIETVLSILYDSQEWQNYRAEHNISYVSNNE